MSQDEIKPATIGRRELFGVVPAGKPLARAIWTESRELAEDMLSNSRGDETAELWCARLLTRSD